MAFKLATRSFILRAQCLIYQPAISDMMQLLWFLRPSACRCLKNLESQRKARRSRQHHDSIWMKGDVIYLQSTLMLNWIICCTIFYAFLFILMANCIDCNGVPYSTVPRGHPLSSHKARCLKCQSCPQLPPRTVLLQSSSSTALRRFGKLDRM